jgi:hypothetical protein
MQNEQEAHEPVARAPHLLSSHGRSPQASPDFWRFDDAVLALLYRTSDRQLKVQLTGSSTGV